jgi:hypothetical protein
MYCVVCGHKTKETQIGQKLKGVGTDSHNKRFMFEWNVCIGCTEKIDRHLELGEVGATKKEIELKLMDEGKEKSEIDSILSSLKFDKNGNELWGSQ